MEGYEMFFYQVKVVVKENKVDEFIACLRSLADGFRKEKGCLNFTLYRDTENENTFSLVGEWKTRQNMEKHFQDKKFEVLVGASKVLCEIFKLEIAETEETGGFKFAREKIVSLQSKTAETD